MVMARWNFLANFAREVVPPILLQKVKKAYLVTDIDNSGEIWHWKTKFLRYLPKMPIPRVLIGLQLILNWKNI